MSRFGLSRQGDVRAMAQILSSAFPPAEDSPARRRETIADFCRFVGERVNGNDSQPSRIDRHTAGLPPRLRETLQHLLDGASEKEVAQRLQLSKHTVHVYVKSLYKRFEVNTRAELLAHCLRD